MNLKGTEKVDFTTKWSPDKDILWLTFNNEQIVRALYRRLADLGKKRIRLIKFVPPWAFERNREIERQSRRCGTRVINTVKGFNQLAHHMNLSENKQENRMRRRRRKNRRRKTKGKRRE